MTDVSNLDNLAAAIATSSAKIRNYAKAQAAATQSQELDIQNALSGNVKNYGASWAQIPGFDSAGNILLKNDYRAAIRFVAEQSGLLSKIHFKTRTAGGASYAAGTIGLGRFEIRSTLPTGYPDLTANGLLATEDHDFGGVPISGEYLAITFSSQPTLVEGREYTIVTQNIDAAPNTNYWSLNFGQVGSGIIGVPYGAQGRNERDPAAPDAFYGLDPRESVMWSYDSGATWLWGYAIPTYLVEMASGVKFGQAYKTGYPFTGIMTQAFVAQTTPLRIQAIGAYIGVNGGSTTVDVIVDGVTEETVTLSGAGHVAERIPTVSVPVDSQLKLRGNTLGVGGADIRASAADTLMGTAAGHGTSYDHWLESGSTGYDSLVTYAGATIAAQSAIPLYPLPSAKPRTVYSAPLTAGLSFATIRLPWRPLAYGASLDVDPMAAETNQITLTGNLTLDMFYGGGYGQRVRFEFVQDATGGRTVTFNAVFKVNWTPDTAASKTNVIEFYWQGGQDKWVQCASATGL